MAFFTPSFFLHSAAIVCFGYAIYYDVVLLKVPESRKQFLGIEYAGRWKYLTFWNAVIQLAYFSFSLINDLVGTNTRSSKDRGYLQTVRDYVFGSIGYPVAMFVATIFWGLYAVDRELIFPAILDSFYPSWLNHAMHSSIAVFGLLEMVVTPRTFPSRSAALTGLAMLMLVYVVWIFFIAWKTDFWVYPIFAVLHWASRLIFIAALLLLAFLMYFTGEALYSAIHGGQRSAGPKGKKPSKLTNSDSKPVNKSTKRKQVK